jgi:hypothetical protein
MGGGVSQARSPRAYQARWPAQGCAARGMGEAGYAIPGPVVPRQLPQGQGMQQNGQGHGESGNHHERIGGDVPVGMVQRDHLKGGGTAHVVEQNTTKRQGVGLRAFNPERASPGWRSASPGAPWRIAGGSQQMLSGSRGLPTKRRGGVR